MESLSGNSLKHNLNLPCICHEVRHEIGPGLDCNQGARPLREGERMRHKAGIIIIIIICPLHLEPLYKNLHHPSLINNLSSWNFLSHPKSNLILITSHLLTNNHSLTAKQKPNAPLFLINCSNITSEHEAPTAHSHIMHQYEHNKRRAVQ